MKQLILALSIICMAFVSCNKDFKSALNMPGSNNDSKYYNTQIKTDEFSDSFYKTCAYGKVNEVKKFIKQGKSVNELDSEGYPPLFYAVLGGNPSAYSECISKLRTAIISDNDTELYEALDRVPYVNSNTKVVEYLLKNDANVQLKDRNGRTVFIYASLFADDVHILTALKRAGANIHEKIIIQYPSNLLSVACMTNPNPSIIDFLCKAGQNIDEQNKFGTTPIMWAAMYTQNPDIIDVLKKNGADINDRHHKDGYSPLIWAVRCNRNAAVTERLCKLGADITITDKYSWHALDWAMLNTPSFKWLEKFKRIENQVLHYDYLLSLKKFKTLRGEGKNNQLKVILRYCNNNDIKLNALQTACFSSNENFSDLIYSIRSFESEKEDFDISEYKVLLIAFDDTEKLKLLNSKTDNEYGLQFYYAVLCQSNSVAEYLLPEVKELNINLQSNILENCSNKESLKIFLKASFIDFFQKDKSGKTLLYIACEKNNYEAAKLLIEKGADVNTTCYSQKSRTPLLMQCYMNYPAKNIVELLLKNGARINAKDEDGVSPLIAACYTNKTDSVIKILINNGANKTEKYNYSYPYEYCNSTIKNNYYSTYQILYNATKNYYRWEWE